MSKEIAQTVGGKKIAWLIAIVAAFAVFATVGSHWQSAKATPTPGSYTVTGPWLGECATAAPATISQGPGALANGASVVYCVEGIGDATVVNPLQITLHIPNFNFTDLRQIQFGGPQPVCTGINTDTAVCTLSGLLPGSTFKLYMGGYYTARGVIAAGAYHATLDDPSDGTATSGSATAALTVTGANLGVTKTNSTATPAAGSNFTYTITVTNPTATAAVAATNVHVVDTIPANLFTAIQSVTVTGGSVGTCTGVGPFPDTTSPWNLDCNIGTLALDATATVTIVGTVVTPAAGTSVSATNTVNVTADNGAASVTGALVTVNGAAIVLPNLCPGLFHVDAEGNLITGGVDTAANCTKATRDVDNNVIGFNHRVCYVAGGDVSNPIAIIPPAVTLLQGQTAFRIDTVSGSPTVTGEILLTGNTAFTPTNGASFGNGSGLTCAQWYSTSAGEQNITVINAAGATVADFADGPTNGLDVNFAGITDGRTPLVKEWNTLAPTTISASGTLTAAQAAALTAATGNLDGTNGSLAVVFNPGTGTFSSTAGSVVFENVLATHTNAAGTQLYFANGASVTFTFTGTCGSVKIDGTTIVGGDVTINSTTPVATVTSIGVPIKVTLNTTGGADCTFIAGNTLGFTAQANYPALLGSNQPPAPAPEQYSVNLVAQLPTKVVFLAWAGQRVILEHDWRVPPGDLAVGSQPAGQICAFTDGTPISYIKGSGPGNFLAGLGAILNGSDQATVNLSTDISQAGDATSRPQGACISRVLYESEDPGEVDIEAFASPGVGFLTPTATVDTTKVAFVVYYMKFNSVGVSLVSQVSKPTHNSSAAGGSDYAPGNPWDASKDAANNTADWNVSTDLLVRGRVKGWFLNANPSGRAADTSDPLNVLPANRWVMPDDWALLAGGPADNADNSRATGTAEAFRPEYDIMVNPGRGTRGLDTPTGGFFASFSTLAVAADATTLTIVVNNTGITPATTIRIDNEEMTVNTVTPNALNTQLTLSVQRGVNSTAPAAHAVGAIVLNKSTTGFIFEGPFSPLDIAGFTTSGLASSAALSAFSAGSMRDTIWKDGDVDMWDAPMPPALVTVDIRGTGFIKQVIKSDVYYVGTPNGNDQNYPNPFYISDIPDSPYIPANVAGGGYYWNSWGTGAASGAYAFWTPMPSLRLAVPGMNAFGVTDTSVSTSQLTELSAIRTAYGDPTISRTLVVYSDNHGEFMVTANGDFKTDLSACATSALGSAGSRQCKPGDKVGTGSIYATADYPDFRGKHFPVKSNVATVNWLWGGYKDVTVEPGETDQFKYVVFHGLDRDGFCSAAAFGAVSLHPVLSGAANDTFNGNPAETVDFLIDSGEGIILTSNAGTITLNNGKQFATGVTTFSTLLNDPAVTGIKEFPLSSNAATGAADECQAWIRVSNSLLGVLNVLVIAHDDAAEGDIGFDKIIDLTNTTSYTLNFRWSLITWAGADGISVSDALKGTGTSGKNPGGNDISSQVTAVYGWDQAAQQWLGYFPTGVNVPGANDLTTLKKGAAYWIAITGPGPVTWTVATNVG